MLTHMRLALLTSFVIVLALVGLSTALPLYAQPAQSGSPGSIPVAAVLNPDGTLNLQQGKSGVLDLAGWNVALDPQHGPVFHAAPRAGEEWQAFDSGVDGYVYAIAILGTDVYVGGPFVSICASLVCNSDNTIANHIARWDGSQWHTLGHGLDYDVYALAVSGSDLYAGGYFTQVCGNDACDSGNTTMNSIARWDGSWHSVGNGIDRGVNALLTAGGYVYAGGSFTFACGNAACDTNNTIVNNAARWNGSSWSALGNGVSGVVNALALKSSSESGSELYVGGSFLQVCGNEDCDTGNATVNRIARWNGSEWNSLGSGVSSVVWALTTINEEVYVGGSFVQACGNDACNSGNTTVNRIADWDGFSLSPIGHGTNGTVYALAHNGAILYAGGPFLQTCGNDACNSGNTTVNRIAFWDGLGWNPLRHGVNDDVDAIVLYLGEVYAGGEFTIACGNDTCLNGNTTVNRIAKYAVPPFPTDTPTATPTQTQTPTRTATRTATGTATRTATGTATRTATPTGTVTGCTTKPSKPTLLKPKNNKTISQSKVKLVWSSVACVNKYKVTVRDAVTGAPAFKGSTTSSNIKTDSLPSNTYQWFVKACNAQGCTKSSKFKFTN